MNKVSVYEGFDQLPQRYQAMFDEAGRSSVFFSRAWFEHLNKTVIMHETRSAIFGVESGDGFPALALPLWTMNTGSALRSARQLTSAANYYTPLYSPACRGSQDDLREAFSRLAHAFMDGRPRWDIVNLHPMDPASAAFMQMSDALRAAGMWVDSYSCFGNWYLDVAGRSYSEYARSLPSRLNNTIARKAKQASRVGLLRMEVLLGDRDLDAGIAAYETVYNASWKVPEAYPAFMPGLIRLCAEQGWLRLGVAYLDDQPVAAQVWIVSHGVASIYKLAYNQRHANLSVGSLLTARLMEHVIDVDLVREVDFLTGDDSYKRDWMSDRRERRGIIAFNPRTVRGVFSALRHFGGQGLRRAYRRFRRQAGAQL